MEDDGSWRQGWIAESYFAPIETMPRTPWVIQLTDGETVVRRFGRLTICSH